MTYHALYFESWPMRLSIATDEPAAYLPGESVHLEAFGHTVTGIVVECEVAIRKRGDYRIPIGWFSVSMRLEEESSSEVTRWRDEREHRRGELVRVMDDGRLSDDPEAVG